MATIADQRAERPTPFLELKDSVLAQSKALYYWGLFNCFVWLIQLPIHLLVGLGPYYKFHLFNMAIWIAACLITRRATIRIPFAIASLVLLHIWFVICTIIAQVELARSTDFNNADYPIVGYFLAFLQGSMLAYFMPESRKVMLRFFVAFAVISSLVAFAQFLKFGPAISLGNRMVGWQAIDDWGGRGGVRSVGLFGSIGLIVYFHMAAATLMISALHFRKLAWWEFVVIGMLVLSSLMSQTRNAYPIIAIVLLYGAVLLFKRYQKLGIPITLAGLLVLILFFVAGGRQLTYLGMTFEEEGLSTWDFRKDVLWPQAWAVADERPWTGVGVESLYAGLTRLLGRDRFVWAGQMDNGYLIALAYGGFPGLVLLVFTVFVALVTSIRHFSRNLEPLTKAYAACTVVIVLFHASGMMFGNMITNLYDTVFLYVLVGMALPSAKDALLRDDRIRVRFTTAERKELAARLAR